MAKSKSKKTKAFNFVEIGHLSEGWMSLRVLAANEMYFELKPKGDSSLKSLCAAIPHLISLDEDLAEAFDDAFRTSPKQSDVLAVKLFSTKFEFRNVECALPPFDEM